MSKTGRIKYIKIPAGFLCCPDLKLTEKVFLGFVYSFNKDGFWMSNRKLGQILGLNESNTSRMISKLEAEGWTRSTGKKSRWRRIYLASSDKVEKVLLCSKEGFTLLLGTNYFASSGKQYKSKLKKERKNSSFTFAEPEKPSKPAQDPPDPERVKRVLADLGFAGGDDE